MSKESTIPEINLVNNDPEIKMSVLPQQEELAWQEYVPIGSEEYEQANQERIAYGKIKVVRFGNDKHAVTLVASIKIDPKTGLAISGHEYQPEAESMQDTKIAFEEYLDDTLPEQRLIIYEGDERVFTDRDEAIMKAADSGLVQHLATKEQIPAVSGEPDNDEVLEYMKQLGVAQEEILALSVAQGLESFVDSDESEFLAGYINYRAAVLGIEGFHEYTEEEKLDIKNSGRRLDELKTELNSKVQKLLPMLNGLYKPVLDGKDLFIMSKGAVSINPEFVGDVADITMNKLSWSGENRINEVAKLSIEMRDRVIYHRIIEAYKSGKSPFVVYGGSHVVTLTPALRVYIG